jgi:hypothetical protein
MTTRSSLRSVLATATTLLLAAVLAPVARADDATGLQSAVQQMRAASCPQLQPNAIAEKAAARINQSTVDFLDHTATQVPLVDVLPGLKILGYGGNKAVALQGATHDLATSIKALLLSGYAAIPDCTYTDMGVNVVQYAPTNYWLTVAVLAGP